VVVSDNDASDAGGEKDPEQEPKAPARPVTAAERRERRAASARPTGKSGAAKPDADKARPAKGKASTEKAEDAKGKATPKRDRKDKKASVFSRLVRFIREVWAELRKVVWPNQKQMVTYTSVVLVFVVFMVALVGVLDLLFAKGVFWLFG
jgi:preprotein translocase subunit SecE